MRWPSKIRGTWRILLPVALGAALVLILFGAEHARAGSGRLIHSEWASLWLWLLPTVILLIRFRKRTQDEVAARTLWPGLILLAFLAVYLVSGAVAHPWFYFLHWTSTSSEELTGMDAGLVRCVFLTAILTPFMLKRNRGIAVALPVILLAVQVLCFAALWRGTGGGAALYRDDHPSFMFRLWEYARTFPRLMTYNPYWNGGVVNFVGTTSGTGAIALPLFPLWRWAPIESVYTPAIGLIYIGIMPWLAVGSVRLIGGGRVAATCAGLLMLGVSLHVFLWMLHFGTVGAVFSSSFLLPFTACVYRVVQRRDTRRRMIVAMAISGLFLLQWPPGALMGATVGIGVLLSARRWTRRTWGALAAAAGIVLLVYLRPLLVIALKGDSLMSHVMDETAVRSSGVLVADWLVKGWIRMASHVIEGHPLLIFLGVGGVVVLPYRSVRRWVWPMLVVLAFLAGWACALKPNLQLTRMAIPFFFVAVIPASLWSGRILRSGGALLAPARALVLALLILGGLNVVRLYGNAGHAPYTSLNEDVRTVAAWMREHVPEDGRVMFAGRCVHYYGRGHVAFLPNLAEREMMACDYYAFPIKTVEYNYPPRAFRRSEERIARFLDLYNVTHVVTYHDYWKEAFREYPDQFQEVELKTGWDRMAVFRVRRESTLFLQGAGRVSATFNRLDVDLDDGQTEAVLKYNWADDLRAPASVELFPFKADDDVTLIGVRSNGRTSFTIRYGRWL